MPYARLRTPPRVSDRPSGRCSSPPPRSEAGRPRRSRRRRAAVGTAGRRAADRGVVGLPQPEPEVLRLLAGHGQGGHQRDEPGRTRVGGSLGVRPGCPPQALVRTSAFRPSTLRRGGPSPVRTSCAREYRSVLGTSPLPGVPEHTMTVTDRRYVCVVKVVASAVQPADPLGFETPLEPGAALSRSDLAGERALPAVQHHPLPRGGPAQPLRRGRATAFTSSSGQFGVRVAQVIQEGGLRCAVSDAEVTGSRADSSGHQEPP